MPEAFFCMWLKPKDSDGSFIQKGQQPRNLHLDTGPEVPADRTYAYAWAIARVHVFPGRRTSVSVQTMFYRTYRNIRSVYDGCDDEGEFALILSNFNRLSYCGDLSEHRSEASADLI